VNNLYRSKLVTAKDNRDGTYTLILSKEGKEVALRYDLENMHIKTPARWDGKWRVVMFDVPERMKRVRESLRMHFKDMGFMEFQKSVFVHPHPCKDEIEYIMEFYNARRYIRFMLATEIDNSPALKKHFKLS
jgi:DNA-binding transcriptional regulator PaaX